MYASFVKSIAFGKISLVMVMMMIAMAFEIERVMGLLFLSRFMLFW